MKQKKFGNTPELLLLYGYSTFFMSSATHSTHL